MKERNSAIELLRILLTFGIVMIHVVGKGAYSQRWLANLLKICVPGFVFITGWFGVKFSWQKLVKLYAIGAYCALVGTIAWALVQAEAVELIGLWSRWLTDMKCFWFLHSYVVLLMVVPILNVAVENAIDMRGTTGGGNLLLPFLIVVFGWAFLTGIGHVKPYVFDVSGFETHSPLSLAGVYVAARYFRLTGMENRVPSKLLLAVLMVCAPLAMVGLANYNSPIAVIIVAALFLLFKRHVKCGTWSLFVAPSMFAIYMLHSTLAGQRLFIGAEDFLMSKHIPVLLMYAIVTVVVFVSCLIVDMCRRGVWRLCAHRTRGNK